jgi:predicted acyl esterase
VVPVDIEILPSSTSFEKGETMRLLIQGSDIVVDSSILHELTVNSGVHSIHSGGRYDSHLLVPVIPEA